MNKITPIRPADSHFRAEQNRPLEGALISEYNHLGAMLAKRGISIAKITEAVQRFASLVVPLLGDWVIVTVLEHGMRRDIGRAHRDPAMLPVVERYADLRARSNRAAAPVPRLISEQRPLVVPALTSEALDAMVGDAESRAALQLLGIEGSAVAAFPMVARGELFGVVTLLNAPGRGPPDHISVSAVDSGES